MLVWSKPWRIATWAVAVPLFLIIYGLPIGVIVLASFSGQWNDILPSNMTLVHYAKAFRTDSFDALKASLLTGVFASGAALVCGTWAALALRGFKGMPKRVLDLLFFIPSAVPSVSVGLALLVAFSQPPFLLNGTTWIVLIAHFVLISAFTYGNVTAGLARIPIDCEQVAESLGTELVAEGVEHGRDLMIVRDLGIRYAQGFLLGRPQAAVTTAVPEEVQQAAPQKLPVWPAAGRRASFPRITAAHLLIEAPSVGENASNGDVEQVFRQHPDLPALPVVDDSRRPLGLINRRVFN